MRARVLQATIAAVAVAVLLLGIPLAIFGARYIYGQEVQRVETRAQDLLASSVNSYERNRSAAVRIPMYSTSPKAKRLEFRCPDPSCNPYLTFSAMLMAWANAVRRGNAPCNSYSSMT